MKIDLSSIDREQFMVHEHFLNGETVYLVQPQHIGVKWNQENKIFRSSVWNSEGELISASFPKFTNWSENPDNFPVPTSLKDCVFTQKLDGSTLIVSKYKGQYILRTRGTLDATLMEKNGHEIEVFKEKILSKLEDDNNETWPYSIIFEWVSPLNRVVLLYSEPEWYLIGFVEHHDYSLIRQELLNVMANKYGFKRPVVYSFGHVKDFVEVINDVKPWKGVEGIVIYSKFDQSLHKIKADDYLSRHRLKSELSSLEKLVDFYFTIGHPSGYNQFFTEVNDLVDYETAIEHQGNISKIIDAYKEVVKIVEYMKSFVEGVKNDYSSRKDQALKIISSYGNSGRSGMAFKMLDMKGLNDEDLKKLLWQCLKK